MGFVGGTIHSPDVDQNISRTRMQVGTNLPMKIPKILRLSIEGPHTGLVQKRNVQPDNIQIWAYSPGSTCNRKNSHTVIMRVLMRWMCYSIAYIYQVGCVGCFVNPVYFLRPYLLSAFLTYLHKVEAKVLVQPATPPSHKHYYRSCIAPVLLRGTIVNRTYGLHKNLYI